MVLILVQATSSILTESHESHQANQKGVQKIMTCHFIVPNTSGQRFGAQASQIPSAVATSDNKINLQDPVGYIENWWNVAVHAYVYVHANANVYVYVYVYMYMYMHMCISMSMCISYTYVCMYVCMYVRR